MPMPTSTPRLPFHDRADAGRRLGEALAAIARGSTEGPAHLARPVTVLALPRGGVPVAAAVADAIDAPLDVIVVRKIGTPGQPELAMGAIGEGGTIVRNEEVIRTCRVTPAEFAAATARARVELDRRVERYRRIMPRRDPVVATALIVDDGIATGATARAACRVARAAGARRVVLAVPVAPAGWSERMGDAADEYVALAEPGDFTAVGQFYGDFSAVTDTEVEHILLERLALAGR
jgi:putative phosphoribosyl transferase